MASTDPHTQSMHSWEANAAFWDESIGHDGNVYWQQLQVPALERMVPEAPAGTGRRVLDLAGGNGLVSRWLVGRGGIDLVVCTDGSEGMVKIARDRWDGIGAGAGAGAGGDKVGGGEGKMLFQRVDVTSEKAFAELEAEYGAKEDDPSAGFDVITCNMAIQDISDIDTMARALPKLLKKGGTFVATLLHPVFFTSGANRNFQIIEEDEHTSASVHVVRSKIITKYLDVPPWRGVFAYDQPEQQYYFHRPLHELFATYFRAGLVMDALEEPAFTKEQGNPGMLESHRNFDQLPAILAFRMRRVV